WLRFGFAGALPASVPRGDGLSRTLPLSTCGKKRLSYSERGCTKHGGIVVRPLSDGFFTLPPLGLQSKLSTIPSCTARLYAFGARYAFARSLDGRVLWSAMLALLFTPNCASA